MRVTNTVRLRGCALVLLAALAGLLGGLPAAASAAPVQQLVQLRAADGRQTPALVTYPEGGPDTGAPVAIIHHGGPGGHALRPFGAARWAAAYLAERGFVTISLLSRISRDLIDQPFGAGVADIQGAVDWAAQLSAGPIVLIGHSSDSVSSALYMAQTNDARVKAIVHYAPTAWGSGWMSRSMGPERYAAVVARMRQLVADGQGDQPVYEDHRLAPPAPPAWTYGYLMSARTWLSWWGPDSINRNIALFPRIRVPMLMVSGDADIFVSREYHDELRRAATASPRVDSVMLEGGVLHEFTGAETKASALAFEWLHDIGVRALPRVATRLVDLKIGTDTRPGVLYEPSDAALRKPLAVMLMPDFADDLMLTPLEALGPRLARAGYTVLVTQDRGSGWPFYRAVAGAVSADQRAWLEFLRARGPGRVAVVAHGFAGTMVPALLAGQPASAVAGVALIEPPPAPSVYARQVLGSTGYARAVADAQAAVQRGEGGTTMVIAPHQGTGERRWLTHMATGFLSFWGPAAAPAPLPALLSARQRVLLVGAGKGRFVDRDAQSAMARDSGVTSVWYPASPHPFETPDALAADIATWLDGLLQPGPSTSPMSLPSPAPALPR